MGIMVEKRHQGRERGKEPRNEASITSRDLQYHSIDLGFAIERNNVTKLLWRLMNQQ